MIISQELKEKGFSFVNTSEEDFSDYLNIKRNCYKNYVDQYFGGWIEDVQIKMNRDAFDKARKQSCFCKIILDGETVGFFGYGELEDRIDEITIQMLEKAQNYGVGSYYLGEITKLSDKTDKPIFLKVFKSNPAQNLYKRFGFKIYDESMSHYFMRYSR